MNRSRFSFPPIIAAQYFIHFGVMGVFLPYFNLYCFHIGLDGMQIGLLSSVRSVTAIIFPLIIGALAERLNRKKIIFVSCCFISTAAWSGFFRTTDFVPMLVIVLFYGAFYSPIISFLEALTVDVLGSQKQSYGKVRVWGSISFILTVTLMGRVIDAFPISIIITAIFAGSFIQSLLSIPLPFRQGSSKTLTGTGLNEFMKKRVLVFLFCAFFMLVSHGGYYGFFSIHLEKLGYDNSFIGAAWALASAMEILSMTFSKSIFKHFSLERVLIFSFFVAALRWLLLFTAVSPVLILFSQMLHAVTYGTFHMAGILYIDRQSPEHLKTLGQSLNNAVTYGLGLMVGFFLSGYVFEAAASEMLFIMSSGIALLGGIIFSGFVLADKNRLLNVEKKTR